MDIEQVTLNDEYSLSLLAELKTHNSEVSPIIIKAMKFAKYHHRNQKRKSGEPYYMHPVAVTKSCLSDTTNIEILAACLLHDIIEDTEITANQIGFIFGENIQRFVKHVTDLKDGTIKLKLNRNIISLKKLGGLNSMPEESVLIRLHDRLHNLETIHNLSRNKQIHKAQETLALYVPVAEHMRLNSLAEKLRIACINTLKLT